MSLTRLWRMSSRSLQNFYSCRFGGRAPSKSVPVLYKISTLVDRWIRWVRQPRSRSLQNFYSCRYVCWCLYTQDVPVLYKISTLVDIGSSSTFNSGSRSLQNFYSCRSEVWAARGKVPVLYKISTLVDLVASMAQRQVPVLYKISTLVDSLSNLLLIACSRSLQNFYSCRCSEFFFRKICSRSLQNFYSCRSLWQRRRSRSVPVLYKISTLVDRSRLVAEWTFPFFTKFLLL